MLVKTFTLTKIVLAVLIIASLIFSSFLILSPFIPAFVWASMIVISTWHILLAVESHLGGKRAVAVLAMTLALVIALLLPLTIALSAIITNVSEFTEQAKQVVAHGIPSPPSWIKTLPLVGEKFEERWLKIANSSREELIPQITPYLGEFIAWLLKQIGSIGSVLIHFLLTLIFSVILYFKGEVAVNGVISFARSLAKEKGKAAVILAAQAIRAVANGVIITAVIQALMASIGLLIAGVPYAIILGSISFLLCVIQIGAAPVLIGALIWLYLKSSTLSFVLFLLWTVVILISDNFLRPFLIKRGANLPIILIFLGVVGGLISLGIIGIFVGPVVLAVSYTLLLAWIDETLENDKIEDIV